MTFRADLLDQFDRDLRRGASLVADDYVTRVRNDRAVPRETGGLANGIKADTPKISPGRAIITITSTHRSQAGADVGTILDQSTGRLIEAKDYGHKAFGPFRKPVRTKLGSTRFLPRFRVTTAHVGWWEQANDPQHLRRAADRLTTVDL